MDNVVIIITIISGIATVFALILQAKKEIKLPGGKILFLSSSKSRKISEAYYLLITEARIFKHSERYESAISKFKEANVKMAVLAGMKMMRWEHKVEAVITRVEMGDLLIMCKKYDAAEIIYEEALLLLQEISNPLFNAKYMGSCFWGLGIAKSRKAGVYINADVNKVWIDNGFVKNDYDKNLLDESIWYLERCFKTLREVNSFQYPIYLRAQEAFYLLKEFSKTTANE